MGSDSACDLRSGDRQRPRHGQRRIHGADDPVLEDHVGDSDERSMLCSTMSA
jgi:hypothetical protein